jgi:hypothetical protein
MQQPRILLELLFIALVTNQRFFPFKQFLTLTCFQIPVLLKCQEMNSYVSEDGEFITDPAFPHELDVSNVVASNDTCLKVKTIVYYENYFRDGWVGAGNDPIARYILILF